MNQVTVCKPDQLVSTDHDGMITLKIHKINEADRGAAGNDTITLKALNHTNDEEKGADVIMFKWGSLQKPFRCQMCDMLFEDGEKLKDHIDKHLVNTLPSSKPYPCKICPKAFQSSKSLERHTQMHYGQVQKRCRFCYKVFANRENLERHELSHNGQKPFKCPQCDEQFVYRQGLDSHMATHSGVRPYVCAVCDKGFNRKDILERHMAVHETNRKKYKCVECNKLFSHSFVLKRHTRAVHSEEYPSVECPICFKVIKCKENLVRHMKIHSGERDFACPECGRKFTQKQHVIDHMVVHTGGTPHQCPYCDESFKHKRTLNRHLRKHSEYKPHVCPHCSQGFAEKSLFDKHMAKHNTKRFQCSDCLMTFKLRGSLKRHKQKIHQKEMTDMEINASETEIDTDKNDNKKAPGQTDNKKAPGVKKLVYVVLKKDKNNQTDSFNGSVMSLADHEYHEVASINENPAEIELNTNGEIMHSAPHETIAETAEKISTQVKMDTEGRIAAGQQVEEAMEEERSNIIQTMIEYAERDMLGSVNQNTQVTAYDSTPTHIVQNIQIAHQEETDSHGVDMEIIQSDQSILGDKSGQIYFEEAHVVEDDQSNTIVLTSSEDQSGAEIVGGVTDLSQILILDENNQEINADDLNIVIRHDEETNNIIVEQVNYETDG